MKNLKINNLKKYLIGFIVGISIISFTFASNYGSIGSLFNNTNGVWSLNGSNIEDGTVTSNKIGEGAISSSNIGNNAITSEKIEDGTIKTLDIGNNAITSEKIEDGTINALDIGKDAITSEKIEDGTIKTLDIGNSTITSEKIKDESILVSDLALDIIGDGRIIDDSLTHTSLAENSVRASELADNSVVSSNIIDETIQTSDIKNESITSTKIANGTIQNIDMGTDSIGPSNLIQDQKYTIDDLKVNNDLEVGGDIIGDGDLDIKKNVNIGGNLTVDNTIFTDGLEVYGPLSVEGITNLNGDTQITGNLVLSGTVAFTNEDNVPWTKAQTNLPFFKIGGLGYIKDYLYGSYEGQVMPRSSRPYLFYEDDGALVLLRPGYNGHTYGLYYGYSSNGEVSNILLTNMKYAPDYFENRNEKVQYLVDGNEHSMTIRTLKEDGTNGYYIIKIDTLNPATHTVDKIIDVTSAFSGLGANLNNRDLTRPQNITCQLIEEADKVLCLRGGVQIKMRMYELAGNILSNQIVLINTIDNNSSNIFFDLKDENYFTTYINGEEKNIDGLQYGTYHTQRANIQYHIDGNNLYIQQINGMHLLSHTENRSQVNGLNIIFKIDLSNNKVFCENNLPIKYDFGNKSGFSIGNEFGVKNGDKLDYYSIINDYERGKNVKPYFFKNKKEILMSESINFNAHFNLYKIEGIDNYLDYFKVFYGHRKIKNEQGFTENLTLNTFRPKDPSYLGKTIRYTKFIGKNEIITNSTSNRESEGLQTNWVQATLPNLKTTVLGNLESLPTPISVAKKDNFTKTKLQTTRLEKGGEIIKGYNIESGIVNKYDGKNFSKYVTLPSNYLSEIKKDIEGEFKNCDFTSKNCGYNIGIVDDNKLIVSYGYLFFNNDGTGTSTIKEKASIYEYGNNVLNKKTTTNIRSDVNSYARTYNNNSINDIASYEAKNGDIYIAFTTPFFNKISNNEQFIIYAKLNGFNFNKVTQKGKGEKKYINTDFLYSGFYNVVGIHPDYGPYRTDTSRNFYSRARSLLTYQDFTSIVDLDTRIVSCYESVLNGNYDNQKQIYPLTIKQAEGFNLYTGETEVFINGVYTKLGTEQYDLASIFGLNNIKNKQVYVYIDSRDIINPKLSFSFAKKEGVVAILKTDDSGLKNIYVLDGLNITSSQINVNTMVVNNKLIIKGDDGNFYEFGVNGNGNIYVTKVNNINN